MAEKYVYSWGGGTAEGNATMKQELGGKGANLAEMTTIGVPVPPGFTVSTKVCGYYYSHNETLPSTLEAEITEHIARLEKNKGATFGDLENPLLVSVRSGAAVSMPGMMDTVLNLGLNDDVAAAMGKKINNERMAYDSYRRFINMFGDVVMGVDHHKFEVKLSEAKKKAGVQNDNELSADELKEVCQEYKKVYEAETGEAFPTDARDQLDKSIMAVIKSWMTPRAELYRQKEKIFGLEGTAVNVQAMAFGNMGQDSGTGVAFTRDPSLGTNEFYGEFLVDAQGEDVVAGIRTPMPIKEMKTVWPDIYKELDDIRLKLEKHYGDMQDVEFTIEKGKLYMLQTRTGKRTGLAAVKIAWDMVQEGKISKEEALKRIDGDHLNQLLFPILNPSEKASAISDNRLFSTGLPAGPGAATGQVVFTADDAVAWHKQGKNVILVRKETSPEDVAGMASAEACITSTGGMTSHAAVVARSWGKCCVVGAGDLAIDYDAKTVTCNGMTVKEGDILAVDGSTGEMIVGEIPTSASPVIAGVVDGDTEAQKTEVFKMFNDIMNWADGVKKLTVRTNADSPRDSKVARALGAQGIGLCRTEHMFFEGDRVWSVRKMILAESEEARKEAIAELLPYQREDFEGIFKEMDGYGCTIRLLDPPLHEFLPGDEAGMKEMAERMNVDISVVKEKIESLHELNPMLGHRGCRLSITYPEICVMQAQAIIEAACNEAKKGTVVKPEIMVPLIGKEEEFQILAKIIRETADAIIAERGVDVSYQVGTMMEIPRATLVADKVSGGDAGAEFFSFGTNDLTQMTFGYSRDDIGSFLPEYLDQKILREDPFQSIDQEGVGYLVERGVTLGRQGRPGLKCGVCGEHGGDPASVKFFHGVGLDYVSCSPYRVPIARLAAAQAVIEEK
ncbi:pyruvate, phosphate dikinase [Chitinivibrio alkaliphilus]|uniref:Pyruvate, phosphate dikinase n=1 Tax=Chitinivibrio alkaliphilus ACht1 TaxID=1313304 RepID=U7D6U3_9BACT|nr:pyruvate, phosphate dikinase [Chitinivibrio alkaliphilus]ERP31658.1 pyruvate phosphate dikinase [Chitinivibrio alkaliphilus ACht1]